MSSKAQLLKFKNDFPETAKFIGKIQDLAKQLKVAKIVIAHVARGNNDFDDLARLIDKAKEIKDPICKMTQTNVYPDQIELPASVFQAIKDSEVLNGDTELHELTQTIIDGKSEDINDILGEESETETTEGEAEAPEEEEKVDPVRFEFTDGNGEEFAVTAKTKEEFVEKVVNHINKLKEADLSVPDFAEGASDKSLKIIAGIQWDQAQGEAKYKVIRESKAKGATYG